MNILPTQSKTPSGVNEPIRVCRKRARYRKSDLGEETIVSMLFHLGDNIQGTYGQFSQRMHSKHKHDTGKTKADQETRRPCFSEGCTGANEEAGAYGIPESYQTPEKCYSTSAQHPCQIRPNRTYRYSLQWQSSADAFL